jgi:signal peptidase II
VLLIWLYRNEKIYLTYALGLITGGAVGNLFDRIKNGAVADFLDFHIASYHWPAFNAADSFVFIGVAILLLEDFFIWIERQKNKSY